MFHKKKILCGLFMVSGFLSTSAYAVTCTTDGFTLDKVVIAPGVTNAGAVVYEQPPSLEATSCYGLQTGNDTGTLLPITNLGYANDGLLNGEGGYLSPTYFTSNDPIPLMDLDGDGNVNDPGWIRLGEVGGNSNSVTYDKAGGLDISNLLSISMTCTNNQCTSGTWSLVTEANIVQLITDTLGRKSFDHLAFVMKAGNFFAIYDFNFNILAPMILTWQQANASTTGFNYETPYAFYGSWNNSDFLNPPGNAQLEKSHVSVWARDPVPSTTSVPEPSSLALLGLGLGLGLMVMRRRSMR